MTWQNMPVKASLAKQKDARNGQVGGLYHHQTLYKEVRRLKT